MTILCLSVREFKSYNRKWKIYPSKYYIKCVIKCTFSLKLWSKISLKVGLGKSTENHRGPIAHLGPLNRPNQASPVSLRLLSFCYQLL